MLYLYPIGSVEPDGINELLILHYFLFAFKHVIIIRGDAWTMTKQKGFVLAIISHQK